jgi:hypothetical protein
MNDRQAERQTEPALAALEPFINQAISIWNFYWKMAWHPRLFAEEYLQAPTATLITNTVKQTVWLVGFSSAMTTFVGWVAGYMMPNVSSISGFATSFVALTLLGLQIIPMAGMLWLLTRRYNVSISQALLFFNSVFNLFLAATLLLYSIIGLVAIPFLLFVFYFRFPAGATDPFFTWFFASIYWNWYLGLLMTMGLYCLVIWGRIFLFSAPSMIAGTLKTSYWCGLWRLLVSVLVPAIVLEALFMSVSMWIMTQFVAHLTPQQ